MAYGRPGVYVTERLLPAPIAGNGAASAAGAAIGRFAQGPEAVTKVTSWYNFVKTFGGYDYNYPATFGVGQFFKNGGVELYIRRVLPTSAAYATATVAKAAGGTLGTVTAKNRGVDGNTLRISLVATATVLTTGYYNLFVYKENGTDPSSIVDDILVEQFLNVKLTNTVPTSDYIVDVVAAGSSYITFAVTDGSTAPTTNLVILGTTVAGSDGSAKPVAADFNTALTDFAAVNRPLVLFAPEVWTDYPSLTATGVAAAIQVYLTGWATANDGFAVLDTEGGLSVAQAGAVATANGIVSNAAIYYPNVYISDPLGRNASSLRKVGPAGSVAGTYLATDTQTGPFKAPAGIRQAMGGVSSTERDFTPSELDTLNSAQFPLNAIRAIPGAGVVIMGARTLKQDGTPNRYVNTRRSLIHLKRSLQDITQFALFEGNDEALWARLRTVISVFLNTYRNAGGLAGSTETEAFFVKVDAENNISATIAAGEVHIEIGVALQFPAEFVVITLSQKTSN